MLYLTTDGFADQFGGPKQKKLKTKGMLELFINVHTIHLNEQKEKIQLYYSDWKGNGDQTDDVCVIGIKMLGVSPYVQLSVITNSAKLSQI
jgi:hypothetical protein